MATTKAKIPPCPKIVPMPTGWRRGTGKENIPVIQRAAVRALQEALPIGKLQGVDVNGRLIGFLTEWHYDDHVTKPGKPIWHPGITFVMPITQLKTALASSQNVSDAAFIQQTRVSGEKVMESNIGAEGLLVGMLKRLGKWFVTAPPLPKVTPPPTAPSAPAKKKADETAQSLLVLGSQVRGDDPYGEDTFGDDDIGVEEYDSVHGADFGDEMGDEDSYGYDEFGFDEFGGRKKKKIKGKAKGKVSVKAKGSIKFKGKAKKRPTPKSQPKPRPQAKPAPRPVSRPVPRPTPQPAPFAPVAIAPEEPIEEPVFEAPIAETITPDYTAQEDALATYVMPAEETPETADEGSDSYDPSAIGNEFDICG